MPGGLFELRKDAITGWWVAVVVDRAYDPSRFARSADPVPGGRCMNCTEPPGGGVRVRLLKAHAFRVAGTETRPGADERIARPGGGEARGPLETQLRVEGYLGPSSDSTGAGESTGTRGSTGTNPPRTGSSAGGPSGAGSSAGGSTHVGASSAGTPPGSGPVVEQQGLGLVADVGSWQTIVAPPEHHLSLEDEQPGIVVEMLRRAREAIERARATGTTAYLQVLQNWGLQAGAFTNHLCLDFYDLPQIPHRVGEELGGAARYLIREGVCPYCRLVRDELASGERVVFEDAASVAFAPYASRSPFEIWVVPRQHQADFGRATDAQLTSAAETLRKVLRLLDALDRPPYNLILHTAPLHERVDDTYHWHWEVHPRLRAVAGLELGTGLPVNPISPEEAVEELRAFAEHARGRDRVVEPA